MVERGQVGGAYREDAVAALPGEVCEAGGLGPEPQGGRGFEVFHKFRHGDGAREADGEMDVVFDAADEEAFAVEVACDGGEVGVERWPDGGFEERMLSLVEKMTWMRTSDRDCGMVSGLNGTPRR